MPGLTLTPKFHIKPLPPALRKDTAIGAEVIIDSSVSSSLIDPSNFSPDEADILRQALYDHSVLVIRNQQGIAGPVLPQLAALFDSNAKYRHSAGDKKITDTKNILSRNNSEKLPAAPQVQIIGSGEFLGYEGYDLNLVHVNHAEFHASPLTEEELAEGQTRFYRWHLDAPLYERLPGKVTVLHSLVVPRLDDQKVVFEDGKVLPIAAGATAFISGSRAFQLLSPEEQEFALNTVVQYAPRAYEWMRDCKATSDGLTIGQVGHEKSFDELPEWSWDLVQAHPMVWRNPGRPDKPALQILGCNVLSLKTTDPKTGQVTEITDLQKARDICYAFQKRMMTPETIFAHAWEEGDLVIFHNYGVWHSITGQLGDSKRMLWQCSLESGSAPEAARSYM